MTYHERIESLTLGNCEFKVFTKSHRLKFVGKKLKRNEEDCRNPICNSNKKSSFYIIYIQYIYTPPSIKWLIGSSKNELAKKTKYYKTEFRIIVDDNSKERKIPHSDMFVWLHSLLIISLVRWEFLFFFLNLLHFVKSSYSTITLNTACRTEIP